MRQAPKLEISCIFADAAPMTESAALIPAADPPAGIGRFPDDYLLFLLAAASASASAGFHARARAAGIKVPEWRALSCLLGQDGLMITRLAALALMEQSAMTRVIERLEARGLVRRDGDAQDRRRVRVWLRPEGRQLAGALIAQARQHEAEVLALLPPEQRALVKPMLVWLLEALPGNPLERD